MLKTYLAVAKRIARIYTAKRLPRASAALSYFFTLTFFPLVICLYTLLGKSYDKAMQVLEFASTLMAQESVQVIRDFLSYVSLNYSEPMMLAGMAVLVTSASAAVRSLQATIGEMQGGQRFQGLMDFLFSLVFSLLFLAAIYFAILVMLTGESILSRLNNVIAFIDISSSWEYMRFLLLAGIEYVIIWGVYEVSKRREDVYSTVPGALLATVAMVVVSFVFSIFISASYKYPLVYGSLASVILLMFWLYTCSLMIYCGAAVNIALRDVRNKSAE